MAYTVIRANLESDQEQILKLWERNSLDIPQGRFSWVYRLNPAGQAICWMLRDTPRNAMVGAAVVLPVDVRVSGQIRRAGIAVDFVVDKAYRVLGPALLLQKAVISTCEEKGFDFLYGYPNSLSVRVLLRAGFKTAGSITWLTKPIRTRRWLEESTGLSLIPSLLAKPFDLALRWRSKEARYRNPGHYSCSVLSAFDERCDALWAAARDHYRVAVERTSNYLNWRYARSPLRKYSIFALEQHPSGNLLGYIVSYDTPGKAHIVDLVSLDYSVTFDALMSEYLLWQERQGQESVSMVYFGGETLADRLKAFGFIKRPTDDRMLVYAGASSPLWTFLSSQDHWHMMEGDTDL
jgi:GNAT superfamily N-acetyltransferase